MAQKGNYNWKIDSCKTNVNYLFLLQVLVNILSNYCIFIALDFNLLKAPILRVQSIKLIYVQILQSLKSVNTKNHNKSIIKIELFYCLRFLRTKSSWYLCFRHKLNVEFSNFFPIFFNKITFTSNQYIKCIRIQWWISLK